VEDTGILDAIGDTPLVRLRRIVPANGAELWIKLEYRNPTGSMKDRIGLSMIEGAERDGLLEPGMTVVEYTGGSTGPALALVCRAKGYRARIVISECFSQERIELMRALGAELELIPAVQGPGHVTAQDVHNMVERAAELAQESGAYATDQFNNPYVIPGHRAMLGREIWEQTGGTVAAFCHGLGTAGSLLGCRTRSRSGTRRCGLWRSSRPAPPRSRAGGAARSRCRAGRGSCRRTGMRAASTTSGRSRTVRRSR
jgi:cysteine synthase A